MTTATTSMPLLIREQTPHATVENPSGQLMSATDAEARGLAAAIGRGDEAAFRMLSNRYHLRLFRFELVLGRGEELLAQDAVQSTFLIAAKKLRSADGEAHLWNWLARVARQEIARAWRKRQRDPALANAEVLSEECPAATDPDPFFEGVLDGALGRLEPEERQLIQIFYFERLSQKQIAEQLNITPKAVSSRLRNGRARSCVHWLNARCHMET